MSEEKSTKNTAALVQSIFDEFKTKIFNGITRIDQSFFKNGRLTPVEGS